MTQINAVLSASGEAHISGSDGRTWSTAYPDLEAARQSVRDTAVATAAAIDEPVHLVISEPAGEQRMLVHANGRAVVDAPHGSVGPAGSTGPIGTVSPMDTVNSNDSVGLMASADSPSLPPSPAHAPAHAAPVAPSHAAPVAPAPAHAAPVVPAPAYQAPEPEP
ncbi:MAG: hypothetical protein HOQ07_09140, partial [Sinomonas sp.]|nr:hypothetical protein [Sinomonas sp.]